MAEHPNLERTFVKFHLSQTEDTPGRTEKMLLTRTGGSSFDALGIKERISGRLHEGGGKQGRDWITGQFTRCVLFRVVLLRGHISKVKRGSFSSEGSEKRPSNVC